MNFEIMGAAIWFASIVVICCLHQSHALTCKMGTPKLGENRGPNLPDIECKELGFGDRCYVLFDDYDIDDLDAWSYGCILKGNLDKCDKSFDDMKVVVNNYCCCTSDLCNTKEFGERCGNKGGNKERYTLFICKVQ